MSHGHHVVKCSCGAILEQCRCMDPNKTVIVRVAGCDNCKAKLAEKAKQ